MARMSMVLLSLCSWHKLQTSTRCLERAETVECSSRLVRVKIELESMTSVRSECLLRLS